MSLTLTLMGLLNREPDLLKNNLTVPVSIDKDKVCDYIVYECAELEVLVGEPSWLGRMIKAWSDVMMAKWSYYLKTMNAVDNMKVTDGETETVTRNHVRTPDIIEDTNTTPNLTTTTTPNLTETTKVAGFNSEVLVDSQQVNTSGSTTNKTTGTNEESVHTSGRDEIDETVTIGKTGGAEKIVEWQKIEYFNIIQMIADDFKERFCLMVY